MAKAGSFNAYFEFAQRDAKPTVATPSGPTGLLAFLKTKPAGGVPLAELVESSGLKPTECREALKRLADSGFVEISGPALSETVKLTPKGTEAAGLL
jgi:hypothetical protein